MSTAKRSAGKKAEVPVAGTTAPTEQQSDLPVGSTAQQSVPVRKGKGEAGEIEGLFITSVGESFRRCGYTFTREGLGLALDVLTEEQIQTLENEPNLKVERCSFSGAGDL